MVFNPNFRLSKATLSQATNPIFWILSLGLAFGVIYRYCWLDVQDPYKCGALLNQGQWLDTPHHPYFKRPFQKWQPPGCLMYEYKAKDIKVCLESRRALYIGDSTTRQIFWATAKKLDRGAAEEAIRSAEKQAGHSFISANVKLQFVWDPFLNSTELHNELIAFRNNQEAVNDDTSNGTGAAALILVGAGLWHARHIEVNPLKAFKDAVDNVVPFMNSNLSETGAGVVPLSLLQRHGKTDLLLLAPVQVPLYESLSPSRAASIMPEKIEGMNTYLRQLSAHQGADVVWSYSRMTWREKLAYEESGLHVVENVASRKADVLLNLRCNAEAPASGVYPFDRTCCSNYGRLSWVQWVALASGLGLLPLVTLIASRVKKRVFKAPSSRHLHALLTFSLAACYCFYADRTQIFNKHQKIYSLRHFLGFCLSTLTLGVLSIRRSVQSTGLKCSQRAHSRISDYPFLSRDQTDEWKGWMQFIILIYHYTGASKVTGIYEIVRLLVASYLFMTGFGHTLFFYQKGDYSLRRLALVLVRLNLLSCVLPYFMRTDYLFYYFAPLVSFWFMVIYFTMRIGKAHNCNTPFLLGKIVVSAILVNVLIRTPRILESIFFVLRVTSRIHWDVTEWRFRVLLDVFIVYVGMLSGIVYAKISTDQNLERYRTQAAFNIVRLHVLYVRIILITIALAVAGSFWALARRATDKYDYNRWHPYVSCFPILSFVYLRNADGSVRKFHSSIFAWLGRCSLETFTLQFHIWLAADTKGLLSTGIFGRAETQGNGRGGDFVLLTAIFLWVSWCVACSTGILTVWIVDGGETKTEAKLKGVQDSELERFVETVQINGTGQFNGSIDASHGKLATWAVSSYGAVGKSLQVRLGVLIGIMWLANVAYT